MTTYNWATIRTRLSQTFKGGPTNTQEARIIKVFEHSPALVNELASEVETAYQRGTSHSPWGLLAKKTEALEAGRDLTVEDTSERETAVRNAEHWIRRTGIHYDRPEEIQDELFGDHGKLRHWHNDTQLRTRMLELWQTERPRGEKTEAEHDAYMAKYKHEQETLQHTATQPKPSTHNYPSAGPGNCNDCHQHHGERSQYVNVQLCDPCLELRLKARQRLQQPAETT